MGLCYAVVNVNFFWESRWLVVKDTWIGYLNPQTGLLKSVVLVDQGFRVQTGADATGTRNGLAIDNLSRLARFNFLPVSLSFSLSLRIEKYEYSNNLDRRKSYR